MIQLLTDGLFRGTAEMSDPVHLVLDVTPGSLHSCTGPLVECFLHTFVITRIPPLHLILASATLEIAPQEFARCLALAVAPAPFLFAVWGCVTRFLGRVGSWQVAVGPGIGIRQKLCFALARSHGLHVVLAHGGKVVGAAHHCRVRNHVLQWWLTHILTPQYTSIHLSLGLCLVLSKTKTY